MSALDAATNSKSFEPSPPQAAPATAAAYTVGYLTIAFPCAHNLIGHDGFDSCPCHRISWNSKHGRQESALSFAGFDSFGEIRRDFEFTDDRPSFYPPAATHRRHHQQASAISMASASPYKFGGERMIRVQQGLYERQRLEVSCFIAGGEDSVFSRPGPSSHSQSSMHTSSSPLLVME